MKLRRKVAAIVLIATTVVCGGTRRASAQDPPPDLKMLMNLDLFVPRNSTKGASAPAASPTNDSLLNQIQTLDSMGYLGDHQGGGSSAPAPRAAVQTPDSAPPPPESVDAPAQSSDRPPVEPAEPPEQAPSSQPGNDVEGPLP